MKLLPAAAAIVLAIPTASAQIVQVVINEVNFTKGAQWIELYNATTTDVKLGGWSMYHATKTSNRFNDYWFGFPATTTIKSGSYMRIHWGAKGTTTASDVYTGDSSWNFLFGHGFEPLDQASGALAICTTKDNKAVNNPNIFSDWWQWGATGFKREALATGNKPIALWNTGTFAPAVPDTASLMRIDAADKFPHPLNAIRNDLSPTPLKDNTEGMKVESLGTSCGRKAVQATLEAGDFAYHGNKDFSLVVKNTNGPAFFENMVIAINLSGTTVKLPPAGKCDILDISAPGFLTPFIPTTNGSTSLTVPLTLTGIAGLKFFVQAGVFGSIPSDYESVTNRIALTISK